MPVAPQGRQNPTACGPVAPDGAGRPLSNEAPVNGTIIRDATAADIPALTDLHVRTWNETYPHVASPPAYDLRERQWRAAFASTGWWFCLVIEDGDGRLIGFAKGTPYADSDLPGFAGQLSKIYVLRQHHRWGLGRRLMGHAARRFLGRGISSMVLFSEPANPSGRFYEALGAERILDKHGTFHGAYGWHDLNALDHVCPID